MANTLIPMPKRATAAYKNEYAFLSRTISRDVQWESREAIDQIISPLWSEPDANLILSEFRQELETRCLDRFNKVFKVVVTRNGSRVVVNVRPLRELFSDEIDGRRGGGGRRVKPKKN